MMRALQQSFDVCGAVIYPKRYKKLNKHTERYEERDMKKDTPKHGCLVCGSSQAVAFR